MTPAPPQPHSIGIDIGGTLIRVGVVSTDQRVVTSRRLQTNVCQTLRDVVEQLAFLFDDVRRETRINEQSHTPIGLAVPGIIDRESGIILRSVNLSFLEQLPTEEPLTQQLSRRVCQPVTLMTDAEAATWGEYEAWRNDGHGNDPRGFMHLRLGTGVACGLIVNGKIVALPRTGGGHLDDLIVDSSADAPLCKCGKRGCLELYASGPALERHALALEYTLSEWNLAAERGTPNALAALDQIATHVTTSVTNILTRVTPLTVIFGGGAFETLTSLFPAIRRRFHTNSDCNASSARLGDNAGIIGAAILAKNHHFASLASARAIDE